MVVMVLMLSFARTAALSILVGRGDRLDEGDLGGACRIGTHLADERLQVGIGEELLEMLGGFPLVDDQDESVTHAEPVVDCALALAHFAEFRQFVGPLDECSPESGCVASKFRGHEHAHRDTSHSSAGECARNTSPRRAADRESKAKLLGSV